MKLQGHLFVLISSQGYPFECFFDYCDFALIQKEWRIISKQQLYGEFELIQST